MNLLDGHLLGGYAGVLKGLFLQSLPYLGSARNSKLAVIRKVGHVPSPVIHLHGTVLDAQADLAQVVGEAHNRRVQHVDLLVSPLPDGEGTC